MKFFLPLIVIAVISASSCDLISPNETVTGTGPLVSATIDVEPFSKVASSGIANINIVKSDTQVVQFTAQEEILVVMAYEVKNGLLILGFEENTNIRTSKDITIDIHTPGISRLEGTGTGDWNLSGAQQDYLDVEMSGTGSVSLYDQEVVRCDLISTGTGSVWVRVIDELNVELTGTGNVYYKGQPIINADITGTGKLISEN